MNRRGFFAAFGGALAAGTGVGSAAGTRSGKMLGGRVSIASAVAGPEAVIPLQFTVAKGGPWIILPKIEIK